MKRIATYIFIVALMTSCEKVIDFDLENAEPQVVIESIANNNDNLVYAKLSYSGDFYNPSDFPEITPATVKLFINNSDGQLLEETASGLYEARFQPAQPGDIFTLEVDIDGIKYSATSELQQKVPVDSVFYQYSEESIFAPAGYRVTAIFYDPPGKGNYYRVQLYVNGEPTTNGIIYLYSDNAADGAPVSFILYRNALELNDVFRVDLWAIDKATYDYYSGLEKLMSDYPAHMQVSPANPVNNISGGALGYFSAIAVTSSKTVTITN